MQKYGIDQASGSCMSTERCTILMATAISARLKEVWISEHPLLVLLYLAQYAPDVLKMLARCFDVLNLDINLIPLTSNFLN